MKKSFAFLLLFLPISAFCQLGMNLYLSEIPQVGLNYELKDKWRSDFRIGIGGKPKTTKIDLFLTYDFFNLEDHEVYLGLGISSANELGIAIPAGVNFYPLSNKKIGFAIDFVTVILDNSIASNGSLGVRYRFR